MKFISTNGTFEVDSFSEAILIGICPDGGLLMPDNLAKLDSTILQSWSNLTYPSLLAEFLKHIVDKDDPIYEYLSDIENEAFKDFPKIAVEIRKLNKINLVELFHGPTLSFKDYALFPLAFLVDKAIKIKSKTNDQIIKQNILTATTGDTGSSVLEAARKYPETLNVFVLFPKERITEIQRLQITTSNTSNGYPIECSGDCDELDEYIRILNEDKKFCDFYNISGLNSVNCGRILCQMAIHIYAYLQTYRNIQDIVNIAIPCGGWGNLISACLAQSIGLPISVVLCTNANDLGNKFIKDGIIAKPKDSFCTLSNAMDIYLPSNMPRLFWIFSDHDTTFCKSMMEKIVQGEKILIPPGILQKIRSVICDSQSTSDDETLITMKKIYDEEKYCVCPHTATAVSYFLKRETTETTNVVLATASTNKFPEAMIKAGLFNTVNENLYLSRLTEKLEFCTMMDYAKDPVQFLKQFIISKNL